jgi:hypothetical protein
MKARMRMQMVATFVFAGLLVFSSLGEAQRRAINPNPGDVNGASAQPAAAASGSAGWSVTGQAQAGQAAGTQAAAAGTIDNQAQPPAVAPYPEPPAAEPTSTGSDHEAVVGNFGIGFFGVSSIPIGPVPVGANGSAVDSVSAPTIGMRYWLSSLLAIEAGLGLGIGSSSAEVGGVDADTPSRTAFALHGGVPLALAYSKHFVFEVVPELNFGISTGSIGDVDLSGFLLELGARAGAEIHFGFMGVPQLALQGSIGLHFSYQSRSVGDDSYSDVRFGTDVYNSPWSIFTESVSAIYYF